MAKVAVTGATGFIGKHLVEALLKRGDIVYPIGRDFRAVECDVIYHLACPSTTAYINKNPLAVMDVIMDGTRQALNICSTAIFVNASSYGAEFIDEPGGQGAYNIAKRCMEVYLEHVTNRTILNYRLPSVYGDNMHDDSFIKRCVDATAYYPEDPDRKHYVAHVDEVVDALLNYTELKPEEITLGDIYEQFNSGRRGLHRPAPDA
jgi:nucleoside-diphosphate-sugar epimerase